MTLLGIRKASMPMKLHLNVYLHTTVLTTARLCDESGGSGALVPPVRGQDTDGLVVAGQTVDTGLDENQAATCCQSMLVELSSFDERTTWSHGPCG